MKVLPVALILACMAAPHAWSAEAAKTKEVPHYVNLSPVAIPVITGGQVVNYVFVAVRIDLVPAVDSAAISVKEPFVRDALVRAAHRTPFTVATDYTKIDEVKLCASLLADARAIAGANTIVDVKVMTQTPKSTHVRLAPRGN